MHNKKEGESIQGWDSDKIISLSNCRSCIFWLKVSLDLKTARKCDLENFFLPELILAQKVKHFQSFVLLYIF